VPAGKKTAVFAAALEMQAFRPVLTSVCPSAVKAQVVPTG
jgi:hypothetical protein